MVLIQSKVKCNFEASYTLWICFRNCIITHIEGKDKEGTEHSGFSRENVHILRKPQDTILPRVLSLPNKMMINQIC